MKPPDSTTEQWRNVNTATNIVHEEVWMPSLKMKINLLKVEKPRDTISQLMNHF